MPTQTVVATPKLIVNGVEVSDTRNLVHLTVTRTLGTAAHTNLRFVEAENAVTKYAVGADLVVQAPGASNQYTQVFKGTIASVAIDWRARRSELNVDAYDPSHKLAQSTVVKTFLDSTAADIIQALAGDAGLQTDISTTRMTEVHKFVQQNSTALRLVTDLAHASGCEWWMEGSTLTVRPRNEVTGEAISIGTDARVLRRFQARFSALDRTANVNVRGWDPATKADVVGTAPGVNNGAPSTPAIASGGDAPTGDATSWPLHVVTVGDATFVAEGIAARVGASLLSARGECDLEVGLAPGKKVKIENVGTKWNGEYYLTEVEHSFGEGQPFITRFVCGSSDDESIGGLIGHIEGAHGDRFGDRLTIGVVTNTQDPDNLGRVKVRFPYLNDDGGGDSWWARVVSPGAGKERGLLLVPEVDDEVLVGFEHGDLRRPYVLGGLWNGVDPPPTTPSQLLDGSAVLTRSWTSREGHQMSIVDKSDAEAAILLNLKGNKAKLLLGGDKIEIIHTDDIPVTVKTGAASIEIATGGDITIKGNNITLDAQQTITLKGGQHVKVDATVGVDVKANAKVSVKGSGGVDVDGSPALTNVKGSMVMIN